MLYLVLTIQTILEILIVVLICATGVYVGASIAGKLQIYYSNWKIRKRIRQLEKSYEEFLQRQRKQELHKKERERYPLFYWRELIEEKLEDGNF